MEYRFKGLILLSKKYKLPFSVQDGILRLYVSTLPINLVEYVDVNGNLVFTDHPQFNEKHLEGVTDDGMIIRLNMDSYFYDASVYYQLGNDIKYICGYISSCVVLDKASFKEKIDKIGFYSYGIPSITDQRFSGGINRKQLDLLGVDRKLASYKEKEHQYFVSIDFLHSKEFCGGQLIAVESDEPLSQCMMEDIYWTMRKFFAFIYQRKEIPLVDIALFEDDIVVGHLVVRKNVAVTQFIRKPKCLHIGQWIDRLSNLFQDIVDQKIYLRHLPETENDRNSFSPNRFLCTVVGLESALDTYGIKIKHSQKRIEANEIVRKHIEEKKDEAQGEVRDVYRRILRRFKDDDFASIINTAVEENVDYIRRFYVLERIDLGDDSIGSFIADQRNSFAHGNLKNDLSKKHAELCVFMDLFILYIQLLQIKTPKEIACQATVRMTMPESPF